MLVLVLIALAGFTSLGTGQEEKKGLPEQEAVGRTPLCPDPRYINLTAPPPQAATPYTADFAPGPASLMDFGGDIPDRQLRHTFYWRFNTPCCQELSGKLILQFRSIQGGGSATSSDAGNDKVYIFSNGVNLLAQPLYTSFPFSSGQTGTKTIVLTPAMLTNHRLSFLVQDDTSVISAKLKLVVCCLDVKGGLQPPTDAKTNR